MGNWRLFRFSVRAATLAGVTVHFFSFIQAEAAQNAPSTNWRVPARAERIANPVALTSQAVARGKALYIRECAVCHGETGRGDGPKAPDLRVHPGDFSRPVTTRQSDGALFYKITRGRTPMPAYRASLSDEERWMLVHFLRTLGNPEPQLAARSELPSPPKTEPAPEPKPEPPQVQPRPIATTTNALHKVAAAKVSDLQPAPIPETSPAAPTASPPPTNFVSRTEYDQLKSDHEGLKAELAAVQAFLQAQRDQGAPPTAQTAEVQKSPQSQEPSETQESIEAMEVEIEELRSQVESSAPGSTRHLLSGFASANFSSRRHEDSAFSANFAPLFLWRLNDRILFEGELDLDLAENDTDLDLVRAQIYYLLNDYVTLGAGKFLSPMNYLEDHLHQVNKLPDAPLAIRELLPQSNVGLQVRGGFPLGQTRLGYAFYAANAPSLRDDDPARLGTLDFDNFSNHDGHLAFGGRVGFYPIPELEIGYGFQFSGVAAENGNPDAFLQSVDLNYVRDSAALKGTVNFLAQWAWSDIDSIIYDPEGSRGFGPVSFDNSRNGGFVQLAYRPTMVRHRILNRLEPILRYEKFHQRQQPSGLDETRWTIGLNYWLLPSAVFKAAYQFGDRSDDREVEAVLLQFKVGF